jgi:hypothetical protein
MDRITLPNRMKSSSQREKSGILKKSAQIAAAPIFPL